MCSAAAPVADPTSAHPHPAPAAVKRPRTEDLPGADNAASTSDSANDVTARRDATLEAASAAAAAAAAEPLAEEAPAAAAAADPAPAGTAPLFASQYGTQQSSQFRGVCWNKTTKRWQAAIYTYGRCVRRRRRRRRQRTQHRMICIAKELHAARASVTRIPLLACGATSATASALLLCCTAAAMLRLHNSYLYLGCFADEMDAARAYDLAALKVRCLLCRTLLKHTLASLLLCCHKSRMHARPLAQHSKH